MEQLNEIATFICLLIMIVHLLLIMMFIIFWGKRS